MPASSVVGLPVANLPGRIARLTVVTWCGGIAPTRSSRAMPIPTSNSIFNSAVVPFKDASRASFAAMTRRAT